MRQHNLDGCYFRVKRGGDWSNICLSDLTTEERSKLLESKDTKFLLGCIDILCDTLYTLGENFDIYRD